MSFHVFSSASKVINWVGFVLERVLISRVAVPPYLVLYSRRRQIMGEELLYDIFVLL